MKHSKLQQIILRFLKETNNLISFVYNQNYYLKNFIMLNDISQIGEITKDTCYHGIKFVLKEKASYNNEEITLKFWNFIVKNYITKETKQKLKQMFLQTLNDCKVTEKQFNDLLLKYYTIYDRNWRKHIIKYNIQNIDDMVNNIMPELYLYHTFDILKIQNNKHVKIISKINEDWAKKIFNFKYINL